MQHCEAVAGGGAAQGGLLQETGGGGVVDEVEAEVLRCQQVGALPGRLAAVGKHPDGGGVDDDGAFGGEGVGCGVVDGLGAKAVESGMPCFCRLAADEKNVESEGFERVGDGTRGTAGAENQRLSMVRTQQGPDAFGKSGGIGVEAYKAHRTAVAVDADGVDGADAAGRVVDGVEQGKDFCFVGYGDVEAVEAAPFHFVAQPVERFELYEVVAQPAGAKTLFEEHFGI